MRQDPVMWLVFLFVMAFESPLWACMQPPPELVEYAFSGDSSECLEVGFVENYRQNEAWVVPLFFIEAQQGSCAVNLIIEPLEYLGSEVRIGVSSSGELVDLRYLTPIVLEELDSDDVLYDLLKSTPEGPVIRIPLYSYDSVVWRWTTTTSDVMNPNERFALAPDAQWRTQTLSMDWIFPDNPHCGDGTGQGEYDEDLDPFNLGPDTPQDMAPDMAIAQGPVDMSSVVDMGSDDPDAMAIPEPDSNIDGGDGCASMGSRRPARGVLWLGLIALVWCWRRKPRA